MLRGAQLLWYGGLDTNSKLLGAFVLILGEDVEGIRAGDRKSLAGRACG